MMSKFLYKSKQIGQGDHSSFIIVKQQRSGNQTIARLIKKERVHCRQELISVHLLYIQTSIMEICEEAGTGTVNRDNLLE